MKKEEVIKTIAEHSVLIKEVRDDVKDIKENHLRHIYEKLEGQSKWLIALLTAIILTLIATIFNFAK